ncbi:flavin reductase family protein [Nocardia sp. bgisy118]|uniref:flavin reductase family protein n=1 Tax=Nocardia sp. bgisy118 TaxID=3413786 RepID=UPI003F49F93A
MRAHSSGVTIITMNSASGPTGFTASSVASVSLEPPLISFNISNRSTCLRAMQLTDSVLIHFLSDQQRHLAERFSGRITERFSPETEWSHLASGEPLLAGTRVWLRVGVQQRIPAGDHTIILGLVRDLSVPSDGKLLPAPLIYQNGKYHGAVPLPPSDPTASSHG